MKSKFGIGGDLKLVLQHGEITRGLSRVVYISDLKKSLDKQGMQGLGEGGRSYNPHIFMLQLLN